MTPATTPPPLSPEDHARHLRALGVGRSLTPELAERRLAQGARATPAELARLDTADCPDPMPSVELRHLGGVGRVGWQPVHSLRPGDEVYGTFGTRWHVVALEGHTDKTVQVQVRLRDGQLHTQRQRLDAYTPTKRATDYLRTLGPEDREVLLLAAYQRRTDRRQAHHRARGTRP